MPETRKDKTKAASATDNTDTSTNDAIAALVDQKVKEISEKLLAAQEAMRQEHAKNCAQQEQMNQQLLALIQRLTASPAAASPPTTIKPEPQAFSFSETPVKAPNANIDYKSGVQYQQQQQLKITTDAVPKLSKEGGLEKAKIFRRRFETYLNCAGLLEMVKEIGPPPNDPQDADYTQKKKAYDIECEQLTRRNAQQFAFARTLFDARIQDDLSSLNDELEPGDFLGAWSRFLIYCGETNSEDSLARALDDWNELTMQDNENVREFAARLNKLRELIKNLNGGKQLYEDKVAQSVLKTALTRRGLCTSALENLRMNPRSHTFESLVGLLDAANEKQTKASYADTAAHIAHNVVPPQTCQLCDKVGHSARECKINSARSFTTKRPPLTKEERAKHDCRAWMADGPGCTWEKRNGRQCGFKHDVRKKGNHTQPQQSQPLPQQQIPSALLSSAQFTDLVAATVSALTQAQSAAKPPPPTDIAPAQARTVRVTKDHPGQLALTGSQDSVFNPRFFVSTVTTVSTDNSFGPLSDNDPDDTDVGVPDKVDTPGSSDWMDCGDWNLLSTSRALAESATRSPTEDFDAIIEEFMQGNCPANCPATVSDVCMTCAHSTARNQGNIDTILDSGAGVDCAPADHPDATDKQPCQLEVKVADNRTATCTATATIPVTKELYREGVLLLDSFDKVLLSLGVLDRQGHHFRGGDGKFFVHRKSDGHLVAEFYLGKDNLYHVERNSNE